jgi:hypothetical protein
MKLYTEEQVSNLIHKIYPKISRDEFCTIMQGFIPIELPSIEEIDKIELGSGMHDFYQVGFKQGAIWVIEQIKQQENE